jgi:hypothetical protein
VIPIVINIMNIQGCRVRRRIGRLVSAGREREMVTAGGRQLRPRRGGVATGEVGAAGALGGELPVRVVDVRSGLEDCVLGTIVQVWRHVTAGKIVSPLRELDRVERVSEWMGSSYVA